MSGSQIQCSREHFVSGHDAEICTVERGMFPLLYIRDVDPGSAYHCGKHGAEFQTQMSKISQFKSKKEGSIPFYYILWL